ncbi:hypothetical protein MAFF301560_47870 (plasmid) [Ralstonia solanacearum]|nr:hypothetical protein MAFF301560_47870 [Ralstonia solanacearum]BEU49464.1 hypothetical protein MAFF211519_47890 [Ralstonia pseudosolanacearum]
MPNRRDRTGNHATKHARPECRHKIPRSLKQQYNLIPRPASEDSEFGKDALGLLKQLEVAQAIHFAGAMIINKAQAGLGISIRCLQQQVAGGQRREVVCFLYMECRTFNSYGRHGSFLEILLNGGLL